ncbi:hypothetical protein BU24DRAFT_420356 [Aaosphaeria arxii CBS 175.79]|uniref:Uncharacterized protein n=1 Tax=Aaosphaeria arxii CBS 175.79 TaxID=1450172 RepID=A0A6A5XWU9_9PLEO|nr:uncharacterized protein BU24DRAFT_420356 [Aaosphaeria arxii CBS 175.79]KAF2017317.1 hypothetical protein BU24DRAFT_420356 [Aaosphaeria arxii CBS 175.79]
MTSLFPHAAYAEDQVSSHAILYLHVTRAAAMMGSFISLITAPTSLLASRYRHKTPFTFTTLVPRLFTHSARGIVLGSVAGVLMTYGRMRGKEEIEWQDRTWRLLENKGEVATDWWVFDGAAAGAVVGALGVRRGRIPVGLSTGVLGGAGIGSSAGVAYMISSYARGRKPA